MRLDPAEVLLEAVGELLVQHRPVEHVLRRGRRRRPPTPRPRTGARNSSCTDSWTITVPSDVHRCPAVPKPENRAPSTASSRSASGVTTIGFLPPSSRQGLCRCRPASSPMRAPTAVEPVKPILSSVPACSACSSPPKVAGPSANTMFSTPSGRPAAWISSNSAIAEAAAYSAGFQTTVLPQTSAGTRYQDGTATGKFPAVTIGRGPDRDPEGEQLLVGHLAGDRLAVQPPALAEEEVAGVDDLLDLAQRLRRTACRPRG